MRNLNPNMKACLKQILISSILFSNFTIGCFKIWENYPSKFQPFVPTFSSFWSLVFINSYALFFTHPSSTSTVCKTKRVSNSSEKRWQLLCIFFCLISPVSKDGHREHLLCTMYFTLFKRNIKKYAETLFS